MHIGHILTTHTLLKLVNGPSYMLYHLLAKIHDICAHLEIYAANQLQMYSVYKAVLVSRPTLGDVELQNHHASDE